MKTHIQKVCIAFGLFLTLNLSPATAFAQGTAFTYQGRLFDGTNAANGTYQFSFALFDAATGGNQDGGPVIANPTVVTNGLFTVTMDFGSAVLHTGTGQQWLEIAARTNGAANFVTLTPRQELTPAPFAIAAENLSGTLPTAQLSGTVGNGQLANDSITVNAGIGLSGGGTVALGGSTTLNATGSGVTSVTGNSDITTTTVGGAVTLGDTATSNDIPNTIVKRDGNGNFYAGKVTVQSLVIPNDPANIYGGSGSAILSCDVDAYSGNTLLGYGALGNAGGSYNTAVGDNALSNGGSVEDTAVGRAALFNCGSSYNTAVGAEALGSDAGGGNNTAVGQQALGGNVSGGSNTAVGVAALASDNSGGNNVALGYNAGWNVTGSGNIMLGDNAGFNVIGSKNIDIGNNGTSSDKGTIRIGTQGTQTNTFIAGIYNTTIASGVQVYVDNSGHLGVLSSSQKFKRDIRPMGDVSDAVLLLQPVTFKYKSAMDPKGTPQFGLVAEQVEKVDPALVVHDAQHGIYTVRYQAVDAMLLNEFLKQHKTVEAQSVEIQRLQQTVTQLKDLVNQLATQKSGGAQ